MFSKSLRSLRREKYLSVLNHSCKPLAKALMDSLVSLSGEGFIFIKKSIYHLTMAFSIMPDSIVWKNKWKQLRDTAIKNNYIQICWKKKVWAYSHLWIIFPKYCSKLCPSISNLRMIYILEIIWSQIIKWKCILKCCSKKSVSTHYRNFTPFNTLHSVPLTSLSTVI